MRKSRRRLATCMEVTELAAPTTPLITFLTAVLLQWYSAPSILLMEPANIQKKMSSLVHFFFSMKKTRVLCRTLLRFLSSGLVEMYVYIERGVVRNGSQSRSRARSASRAIINLLGLLEIAFTRCAHACASGNLGNGTLKLFKVSLRHVFSRFFLIYAWKGVPAICCKSKTALHVRE